MPTQAPKEMHGSQANYAAATASDEQSQAIRLLQMRQRLATLNDEARSIRTQMPGEFRPDVERIQQQMQLLGERLSELSGAAIWQDNVAEMTGQTLAADIVGPAEQIAPAVADDDADDAILRGAPMKPENPWDEQSANALTRFYETGEAYYERGTETAEPSSVVPGAQRLLQHNATATATAPVAAIEPAWLDRRFAEIAERIENSLAEYRPDNSLLTIGRRFDQLEQRMATALHGVTTRDDLDDLMLAEEQIDEISGQLDHLKRQLARLDTIDAHLGTLTEQLSDDRLNRLLKDGSGDAGARLDAIQAQLNEMAQQLSHEQLSQIVGKGGMHTSDLEGLAAAAALKTAAHIADQNSNESQIHEIGQVRGLLESFITERRNSDDNNASMLDTMQQAIVRVLDRIDMLEASHKKAAAASVAAPAGANSAPAQPMAVSYGQAAPAQSAPAPASDKSAPVQAAPAQAATAQAEPAGYAPRTAAPEAERNEPVVLASTQFSATPFDLNAAFAAAPRQEMDRFGGNASPESLRHDFIADAQRAKLKAASKVGAGQLTNDASFMGMDDAGSDADDNEGQDDEAPPRRSIFSLRSPRTLMTILTLLAAIPAAVFFMPRTQGDGGVTQTIEQYLPFGGSGKSGTTGPNSTAPGNATPGAQGSGPGGMPADPAGGGRTGRTEQVTPDAGKYRDVGSSDVETGAGRVDTAALPDGLLPDGRLAPSAVMRDRVLQANGASVAVAVDPVVARLNEAPEMPAPTVGPYSLRQAAMQGDPSAQYEVAVRIGEGQGTAQDSKEAALWYLRSAVSGFAIAQFRVGTLYERGLGVTQNIDEAQAWYTRAAEQGNVKAMHNLAVLIAGHSGAKPDYATASKWFVEAAERGLADSQYNLAVLLESGLGVEKDLAEASKWLTLAAKAGDADAKTRLKALQPTLSAADRATAETLVRSWRVKPTDPATNDSRIAGQIWKQRLARG
jgi:localization factor PodJL